MVEAWFCPIVALAVELAGLMAPWLLFAPWLLRVTHQIMAMTATAKTAMMKMTQV